MDELFRDIMTGCFKTRPAAPVKYILEYLASAYPEESLEHARAFIDLKEGILTTTEENGTGVSVDDAVDDREPVTACDVVEAPLMASEDKARDAATHDAAPAEERDDDEDDEDDNGEAADVQGETAVEDSHDDVAEDIQQDLAEDIQQEQTEEAADADVVPDEEEDKDQEEEEDHHEAAAVVMEDEHAAAEEEEEERDDDAESA